VQAVIRFLNSIHPGEVVQLPGIEEHVMFKIPVALAPVPA
jgi:hypothetical protein